MFFSGHKNHPLFYQSFILGLISGEEFLIRLERFLIARRRILFTRRRFEYLLKSRANTCISHARVVYLLNKPIRQFVVFSV